MVGSSGLVLEQVTSNWFGSVRRLRAKPEKIIVDLSCRQPQFLEYALHGVADGVIVRVKRPGILRPARRSSCAAASKGLIALFLRTTSAAIARSPFGKDSYRWVFLIRRTMFLPRSFFRS